MSSINNVEINHCNILACQMLVPQTNTKSDRQLHVRSMIKKIDLALSRQHADVVVLPELSTIEYSRPVFGRLSQLAESLDGESVSAIQALALRHHTTVVFGMPRKQDGAFFISQITIAANGALLGCYDKLHICQYGASMEKEFFRRGNGIHVFAAHGYRFAPIICYDIRMPELCRSLATKHRVDCILHCGAYYRDLSFNSWHAFAKTRAIENQLYLLSLNRAGRQYGDSIFCLPWMDERQTPFNFSVHGEDFQYFELNRSLIQQAREEYTFLQDRLDDYESLKLY